eukprot:scaffold88110_cov38-Attheya_sp.AAC.1
MPRSVWDQGQIKICLYMLLRGDLQIIKERNAVEGSRKHLFGTKVGSEYVSIYVLEAIHKGRGLDEE